MNIVHLNEGVECSLLFATERYFSQSLLSVLGSPSAFVILEW